ncbi:MAG: arginase family protein [Fibrobacter sp.]|nr:arginase family protein [Fibrobacter sp.]
MQFYTTIQDFAGVYGEQPFMQALRANDNVRWMDCTQISGTDCYCDDDAQAELRKFMTEVCNTGNQPGVHFFDNGNYHYNSKLWTDYVQEPFDLVIFDHHPDMQPPRFEGILSCGGWVKEVLDHNPNVRNVVIIGVANHLVEEIKNEPSTEFEKYADRVVFVTESGQVLGSPRCDAPRDDIAKAAIQALSTLHSESVYISIDKDALALSEVVTNWDQGSLTFAQLDEILRELFANHKILGVDVCGERATNQDYADGMDEGSADVLNNAFNEKLFNLLRSL